MVASRDYLITHPVSFYGLLELLSAVPTWRSFPVRCLDWIGILVKSFR